MELPTVNGQERVKVLKPRLDKLRNELQAKRKTLSEEQIKNRQEAIANLELALQDYAADLRPKVAWYYQHGQRITNGNLNRDLPFLIEGCPTGSALASRVGGQTVPNRPAPSKGADEPSGHSEHPVTAKGKEVAKGSSFGSGIFTISGDNKNIQMFAEVQLIFDTGSDVFTLWDTDLAELGWPRIDDLETKYSGYGGTGQLSTAGGPVPRKFIWVEKRLMVSHLTGEWVYSDWSRERASVGVKNRNMPRLSGAALPKQYHFVLKKGGENLMASQTKDDMIHHIDQFLTTNSEP
ncbi:hypothetical protein GJ744_011920 [Endocarpon pusillum]|uniref:Peptidase A2 domain-containing protein n=1 Tax=Endocarpon pusillum TaxID=364733 RepID=A0A8H7E872_9EURO|nr:hypothetical protein GJ744_011920 [Endocarpon pusillum]